MSTKSSISSWRERALVLAAALTCGCYFESSTSNSDDYAADDASESSLSSEANSSSSGSSSSSEVSGEEDATGSDASSSGGGSACKAGAGDCDGGAYCVHGECVPLPDDMIEIAGGIYSVGCAAQDLACEADEEPLHEIVLSSFAVDRHEVTVADYWDCVLDGACSEGGGDALDPLCNFLDPGKDEHPINCIGWEQAQAYCAWRGGALPTESQWEAAARGDDGRIYPWGDDTPTCDHAIIVDGGSGCGTGETWTVGSKPQGASPRGALDMTGNVAEWTADWYGAEIYAQQEDMADPAGASTGSERVARGGALHNGAPASLRAGNRNPVDPSSLAYWLGMRCVLAR